MQTFDESFRVLFEAEFPRLFRYLDRLSGDSDVASDLVQEAFIRLHQRGSMPEHPGRWLVTVALNLFRNLRSTSVRRARLLTRTPSEATPAGFATDPVEGADTIREVRAALQRLSQRERELLLLRAEGYSYHDMAVTLNLHEASIGTLLARAKRAFREAYEHVPDAS